MLLTTEPGLQGQTYTVVRIIFGVGSTLSADASLAIGEALAALEREAVKLSVDAVIGVHLSTTSVDTHSTFYGNIHATVMGTAVRFLYN